MNDADLFESNKLWATNAAKNYMRTHYNSIPHTTDMSEIRQMALIGLWQACNSYKPHIGKFKTFAYHRVIGNVKDHLRDCGFFGRTGDKLKLNQNIVPMDDIIPGFFEQQYSFECVDEVQFIFKMCGHFNSSILESYYIKGLTMKEISKIHSLTEGRICQIIRACLQQIRSKFNEP